MIVDVLRATLEERAGIAEGLGLLLVDQVAQRLLMAAEEPGRCHRLREQRRGHLHGIGVDRLRRKPQCRGQRLHVRGRVAPLRGVVEEEFGAEVAIAHGEERHARHDVAVVHHAEDACAVGAVHQGREALVAHTWLPEGVDALDGHVRREEGLRRAELRQRAAEARMAANLNVLARQLETSISQIHKSVKGGRDESIPTAVYLAQIEQCIDHLIGVTHEIGEITGRQLPFDVIEMLSGRDTLQIEARITDDRQPERKLVTEIENCPACKKQVEFQVGSLPGDSAKPTCPHCGQRFHAHRSTSGNIFLRMPGASQFTRAVSVNCPVCASKIPANIDQGKQHSETRFCFSCGAKVSIDPLGQQCTLLSKQERLPGHLNPAGALVCETCHEAATVLTSNSSGTYGICRKDDALVFVPNLVLWLALLFVRKTDGRVIVLALTAGIRQDRIDLSPDTANGVPKNGSGSVANVVNPRVGARYHVTDAATFYNGTDVWIVPDDPTVSPAQVFQPPYYLTLQMPGTKAPAFSLTTYAAPLDAMIEKAVTTLLGAMRDALTE